MQIYIEKPEEQLLEILQDSKSFLRATMRKWVEDGSFKPNVFPKIQFGLFASIELLYVKLTVINDVSQGYCAGIDPTVAVLNTSRTEQIYYFKIDEKQMESGVDHCKLHYMEVHRRQNI